MLILIVGDTHCEITYLNRYYRALKANGDTPDIIIQLGDFGFFENMSRGDWKGFEKGVFKFPCPTYVIHGNHDDDLVALPYMNGKKTIPNFYVFPRFGDIITVEANGESITLFGVGGALNGPGDISSSFPFEERIEYMKAYEVWTKKGSPAIDLLLTHEAPTGTGAIGDAWRHKDGKSHLACGDAGLRYLWASIKPRWQLNGHYHIHHTFQEGGLKHKILPAAPGGATLLDTETWRFQDFTLDSLLRIQDELRKKK